MSEALVPVVTRPPVARTGSAAMALPAVIVDAGPVAVERFLEFFAASIANGRTRGGVRAGRGAVPVVVCGSGAGLARDRPAARGAPVPVPDTCQFPLAGSGRLGVLFADPAAIAQVFFRLGRISYAGRLDPLPSGRLSLGGWF